MAAWITLARGVPRRVRLGALPDPQGYSKRSGIMVFVLDKHKKPLMPCTEKRARLLLQRGRAVIHKLQPFTIRLKDRTVEQSQLKPLRLKLDPGARVTGMAVLREDNEDEAETILLADIHHKTDIKARLDARRAIRRSRRNRKTRYRKPRFLNRRRTEGWLSPLLKARVNQTLSAANKLLRLLPVTAISTEHVKFDTQKLQNPEISGIEYQRGALFGYEVKEYLLEKWGRRCAYCGRENVLLEVEHIVPKSRGGTNRVSNLTLACHECNQKKGNMTAAEFGYPRIQVQAKQPLKEAIFMNVTRWYLYQHLKTTGLPVECGSGALTKMNRITRGLPKEHCLDACCVGQSTPLKIHITQHYVQIWRVTGRGTRQMCNTDRYGFPRSHRQPQRLHFGFMTGDIVAAEVPKGKYRGHWVGRVATRASGQFDIKDTVGKRICQSVSHRYFRLLQRNSGWQYEKKLCRRSSP